mgnify:CR=1 FL=1
MFLMGKLNRVTNEEAAMKWLANTLKDQKGQGMVEYALILALIALAVIGILKTMGGDISSKFTQISSELVNASATTS